MLATIRGSHDAKHSSAGTSTSARRRTSMSARENACAVSAPWAINATAKGR
jgi:hypothetical protein